jgi:hypothetical protein
MKKQQVKQLKQLKKLNDFKIGNLNKFIFNKEQSLKHTDTQITDSIQTIKDIDKKDIVFLEDTYFNRLILEEELKNFSNLSTFKGSLLDELDYFNKEKLKITIFDNKVDKLLKKNKKDIIKKLNKKLLKNTIN